MGILRCDEHEGAYNFDLIAPWWALLSSENKKLYLFNYLHEIWHAGYDGCADYDGANKFFQTPSLGCVFEDQK